ncbi:MAG: hypothetical protein ACXVPL_05175 [Actinomycetota bacterium]
MTKPGFLIEEVADGGFHWVYDVGEDSWASFESRRFDSEEETIEAIRLVQAERLGDADIRVRIGQTWRVRVVE